MLLGNKNDLDEEREISREEGQKLGEDNGFLFEEVSAKTGDRIKEVFRESISTALIDKFQIPEDDERENEVVSQRAQNLNLESSRTERKSKCC